MRKLLCLIFMFFAFGCATSSPLVKDEKQDPEVQAFYEKMARKIRPRLEEALDPILPSVHNVLANQPTVHTQISGKVSRDGVLSELKITKASGLDHLDDAALRVLTRSSPLGKLNESTHRKLNGQFVWDFQIDR